MVFIATFIVEKGSRLVISGSSVVLSRLRGTHFPRPEGARVRHMVDEMTSASEVSLNKKNRTYRLHVMEIILGLCFLSPTECTFSAFLNKMRLPGSTKSSTKKKPTSLVSEKS